MNIHKSFYSVDDVRSHIATGVPTLYHSSQTSTVIPFEKLQGELLDQTVLGNLSMIKGEMNLDQNKNLVVKGFVTWKEAKEFCLSHGREVMTSPTEELAGVLAGIATSCTGERSFGFKNLRSQIVEIEFLNYAGEIKVLKSDRKLNISVDLTQYQNEFAPFKNFKNAPFPRLEFETDLMTGTEGQLGIITSATLKTVPHENETYVFILLPKWERDFNPHLELFHAVQNYREQIRACEMIDANSISYLPHDKKVGNNQDVVFLEIKKCDFEYIFENVLEKLKLIEVENIFEMNSTKCRELRMGVPRAIFEENTRMGVTKKGTDVQIGPEHFSDLLNFYRGLTNFGINYNLFGHFGDAHLHFNFMPTPDKNDFCNNELQKLYQQVKLWHGSPFAEHGIGLLKKKFINSFYNETQKNVFRELKKVMDPKRQFFAEGFMS